MKNLIIACILLISATTFATSDPTCAIKTYPDEIKQLMGNCKSFFDADLSGTVNIAFSVDANNKIHIYQVNSANVFLENHALCALEGAQLSVECLNADETYTISVIFKDRTYQ